MDVYTGTKERIFNTFIEMASQLGYENVSIRDITNRLELKPASMYNHFDSKDHLLNAVYEYYAVHQYDTRIPPEIMKKMVMENTAEEIIYALTYTFENEDIKQSTRMILITKIIYMRLFQDQGANRLFMEGNANNVDYVTDILKFGVDSGRIDPDFDYKTFADILIGANQIMGINAFANVTYVVGQLEQHKKILALLARLLNTGLRAEDQAYCP
jgi:AcrR family transcriptional regulator